MKSSSLQKGFTLLELAVVIVILAAIAVISAPRFLSIADDAREATSRALLITSALVPRSIKGLV
ncbi:type II secretion system protein [Vibrio splendidus]